MSLMCWIEGKVSESKKRYVYCSFTHCFYLKNWDINTHTTRRGVIPEFFNKEYHSYIHN
jgi:hypothetical protein